MNYFMDYQQQTYDHSSYQIQAYDQSAANYYSYSYHQYNGNTLQPHPYYNLTAQTQRYEEQQEPEPPGVSGPSQEAHNSYYQYYQHAAVLSVGPQKGVVNAGVPAQELLGSTETFPAEISQPQYEGTGGMDGRPSQEGVQLHSGLKPNVLRRFHGKGRGRGHALRLPPKHASAPSQGQRMFVQGAAHVQGEIPQPMPPSYASSVGSVPMPFQGPAHAMPVLPSPKVAWCELCRVDCNTLEILEKHKNGKKHKKNLKVYEEIQKLNKCMTEGRMVQISVSELRSEVSSQRDQIEGYGEIKLQLESLPFRPVNEETTTVEKRKVEEIVEPTQESAKKVRTDSSGGQGRKHKMKNAKSGRTMGLRRAAEPPKPKEVIPLICELCNVKCDTPAVFQCHLMGKKHQSKAKIFLGHQEILGQQVLEALSPAILALLHSATNASTPTGPQLHKQSFVPFHGVDASALDAKTMNFQGSASGINAETSKVEAIDHPSQYSGNYGAGCLLNTKGKLNEGLSNFGIGTAVSSTVAQTECLTACAAIPTSGTALNVSSVVEHCTVVPPSDRMAHPGLDAMVKGGEESTQ